MSHINGSVTAVTHVSHTTVLSRDCLPLLHVKFIFACVLAHFPFQFVLPFCLTQPEKEYYLALFMESWTVKLKKIVIFEISCTLPSPIDSRWTPHIPGGCGFHHIFIIMVWSPGGLYKIHMDSTWTPYGVIKCFFWLGLVRVRIRD